ncbi:hypothetical protein PoB_001623200 [Plakobranchus ocellatus]|uniref:Uncharacterized protein n=1 Tax=Plakobranchus ocellatus TaxID=259542 RepID=A0AAV3Z590_9GAST|nr:hypothetical protein PoB_001623200 [Plakobranchus ocellatus]
MLYPILAILNLLVMLVSFVINGLSGSGPDGTIFKNTTGDLSDYFATDITPAGWTFSIWGFIYAWQAAWVLYSVINICRRGYGEKPAYTNPEFLPPAVIVLSSITSCLGIAWLISFDRLEVEVAFVALICYSLGMYAALVLSYRGLDKACPTLAQQGRTTEIWLTRALVHNGLAIQATWVSVATLLNLAMVLTYSGDKIATIKEAGTVSLSVLTVEIVVFAVTDLFLLDRYTRYTLTPYAVLVVALSGSISKNYSAGERNSVFTVVLLAIAVLLAVIKLIVTIYKHFRKSRYLTAMEITEGIGLNKGSGIMA